MCRIAVKSASTTAAEGRRPRLNIGICKLELLLVIFGSLIWLDSDDVASYTVAKPGVFEEASEPTVVGRHVTALITAIKKLVSM